MGLGTRKPHLRAWASHHMDPSQEGPDSTLQDSGDQKEIIWEGGSWVEFELSRTKPGKSQEVKHEDRHTKENRASSQEMKCPGEAGARETSP